MPVDIGKLRPTYCVWELTLACNLRCGHCGSRAGKPRPDEMSTSECLRTVAALADLGCEVITLSGGEPTLRNDWPRIARAIRDRGLLVNMVTNGYRLDRWLATEMKQAGLCNVGVSIDGPEEVHDRIRGRGTFQKTCRSLGILADVGLPTTVMTTVNTWNLPRLEEVHDIAIGMGAARWRCQLAKPMGNLAGDDDFVLRPRDLLRLLPALHRLHELGEIGVGIGDSIGYFGPYDTALRALDWRGRPQCWAGCQAGMRAIGIEANGGVKGCLSMQAFSGGPDPFLEGNLRERPLASIWNDPQAFAYNRRFSLDSLGGFCGRCGYRRTCRGGARCMASAATGTLREDPYCFHRVTTLANHSALSVIQRHAATAATAVALVVSGCGAHSTSRVPPRPSCDEVDCGDPDLSPEDRDRCCAAGEYGIDPCADVDCADPDLSPEVRDECCSVLEYGVEPDYGVDPCMDVDCGDPELPADVWALCCVGEEYGIEPCEKVDCRNPDPKLPVAEYEACCGEIDCGEVCCDCDYGEMPPPQAIEKCCNGDGEGGGE